MDILAVGLISAVQELGFEYGIYALTTWSGELPGGQFGAWLPEWIWIPATGIGGAFLFLLFPTGRPPSPRWRPVGVVTALVLAAASAAIALRPGPMEEFRPVPNPFGIDGLSAFVPVLEGGLAAYFICTFACALSLAVRFRRSEGVERQQLKWLVLSAGFVATSLVVTLVFDAEVMVYVVLISFLGVPVSAGVAIVRYRLYDIDLIIRRTLAYGMLTAGLTAAYFGGIVLLQAALRPLTQESDLAVVGSTLAVAALFSPARRRIQGFVDRRFFRGRYDAARTLDAFTARLRDQIDIDTLGADLRSTVHWALRPAHVSLWLRRGGEGGP